MEGRNRKILFSIVLFLFLVLQPSCRVFKKDIKSRYDKTNSNSELIDKGKVVKEKDLDSETLERREINVKFFEVLPKPHRNPLDVTLDYDFEIDVPNYAIDRLIERISELSIKVETQKTEHEASSRVQEKDFRETKITEQEKKDKAVAKESNSTIGANVPWYAWVIGAILIFGIVWYLVKQVKPV